MRKLQPLLLSPLYGGGKYQKWIFAIMLLIFSFHFSMVSAQSIIVVDKNGKSTAYDPKGISSIDFQTSPPGFTINQDGTSTNFSFDLVKMLQASPYFVFTDPNSVEVDGEGETFSFQVRANTEFNTIPSASWITITEKDGHYDVNVAMNPSVEERSGIVLLAAKDGKFNNSLTIKQAGKDDSRYIAINWEKDKLDSYDHETGEAQITFAEEVPIMGEYDVLVLPYGEGSIIRVINEVTKYDGKTVTLKTEKGDLGDLFKDVAFSLEFGEGSSSSVSGGEASARSFKPVYRPVKIAEFDGEKYVEVYNADRPSSRSRRVTQQLALNYDGSGKVIWEEKNGDEELGKLSLDSYKSILNLTGNVDFEFKKERKGRLWHGNITKGGISISGNSEAEIVPNFKCNADRELRIPKGKTTLENKVVTRKYTFEIQGIMLDLYFDVDMLCNYEFKAEGLVDVTAGYKKTHSLKYGWSKGSPVDWTHEEKDVAVTAVNKKWSVGYPYTDSYLELSLLAYPRIRISVMGENCGVTDFLPKEEVIINTSATPVMTGNPYLNKKLHHQYRSSTDYILYAFLDFENETTIAGEPTDLTIIPQQLEMVSDKQIWVMENDEQEVKFRVTHKDCITGQFVPSAGALVMFQKVSEDDPIEFPEAPAGVNKQKNYAYADENGYVTSKIKLLPTEINSIFYEATLIDPPLGEEGSDYMDRGIVSVLRHDLQCLNPEQEIDENTESVPITFELKRIKGSLVEPVADQMVEFTVVGGTVEPLQAKTNAEGRVTVSFKPYEDATEGSVKALTYIRGNVRDWVGTATGKITIKQSRPSKEKAKPKIRVWDSGESGGDKPQVVDDKGNGEVVFVVEERIEGEDADRPVEGAKVEFETDNQDDNLEGFSWATSGKDGKATCKFMVPESPTHEPYQFQGFNLKAKATIRYSDGEKVVETTVKVNSDGTLEHSSTSCDTGDEQLNKADQLDNAYVIKNKRTGETETRTFTYKWSEYSQNSESVSIMLEDADANGGTQGMVYGFLPLTMKGVVAALTGQTFENTPGAKIGFELFAGGKPIMGSFAKFSGEEAFGSMKPESRVLLREPCNKIKPANVRARRAPGDEEEEYTGDYEFLFYFVFTNEAEEDGDEYEVYGKGTMHTHIPTLYYFDLDADKDWVRVGESTQVTLAGYREEGATWDWNDVEIVGQASNYNDAYSNVNEGYFTWDVATKTLTSVKSNDNKDVYIAFALKSNPEVKCLITVATGEGWKYTMIKPSVDEFTYTGYGYLSFNFDFAPKDSEDEKIDFNALEIDPETNPNNYFSLQKHYGPQGWPIYVNNAPAGEYTVRIWVKSNHDVNCTIKVISKPEEE